MGVVLEKLVRVRDISELDRNEFKLFNMNGYAIKKISENSSYDVSYEALPPNFSPSKWLLDKAGF